MPPTKLDFKEFPGGIEYTATTNKTSFFVIYFIVIAVITVSFLHIFVPNIVNDHLKIPIALISALILIPNLQLNATTEKLQIITGLGLKIQRNGVIFPYIKSIPTLNIKDVYIHEAILPNKVVFYLLIELHDCDDIIVPFKETFPSCAELINVKKQISTLLQL
ncbi:phosphatidylinositol N-acetylglucosaminyltransferase subunit H, putative (PIGH) [Babesia microti strain RI]|uniref:Phosphatidylinositol N-acetylglucosaminyltransferase subunit H, putative (PIGH) n=1 Tax=Babesia microti (strain RI) TaxID=1133968 RepID=A0A1N6LW78_BABMR|nr:phosphatidylinositol N-acetylglucosaminyltransferase subunit H, putative (PIGH) [Babesia microti strain RI]SIO73135.1 phosphatidylinositol N-acetylglucosaminyltransferase subunit H, putative (PIGH) [Babesia microti strain RI]|eukprot:XP_021337247.1 phosphatidylinositol N-acetylglucosaminyltransferase subunit H, putative (PIGH) [Babesia microti strain RI]